MSHGPLREHAMERKDPQLFFHRLNMTQAFVVLSQGDGIAIHFTT
jgi:hypothetical protein